MSQIDTLIEEANATLADLRAGKIDARTAQAAAAQTKNKLKTLDNEIAMARHGQLLKEMQPIWRKRLGLPAV